MCQHGAREVQKHVLETLRDSTLIVYAVWEPILRADDEHAAQKATLLLPDPRVEQFWTPSRRLGMAFQKPLELKREPAWDVYLVYPKGVRWVGEDPPPPVYFMHQLRGRLSDDRLLDGEVLAEHVRERLGNN